MADSTSTQTDVANASIKNFLQGVNFPPTTKADRDKMKAAIEAFKQQIKKTKETSAKKAKTAGKTGKGAASKTLAAQNADKVGNDIPDIKKFLPAGTDTSKITFDAAINSMQAAITQLEALVKAPANETSSSANAAAAVSNLSTAGKLAAAVQAAAAAAGQIKPKQTVSGAPDVPLDTRTLEQNRK